MKFRFKLRLSVREMESIPWGYGVAFSNFGGTFFSICYPIPFNWIIRWLGELYFWLVQPKKLNAQEQIQQWKTVYEESEKKRMELEKIVSELEPFKEIMQVLK